MCGVNFRQRVTVRHHDVSFFHSMFLSFCISLLLHTHSLSLSFSLSLSRSLSLEGRCTLYNVVLLDESLHRRWLSLHKGGGGGGAVNGPIWRTAYIIWAATWQNQQNECAPSEDSDQPGLPSLTRVFAVRMKNPWVLSYPLSAQRMPRLIWVFAERTLVLSCRDSI